MSTGAPKTSENFGFLEKHDAHLARLAAFAEVYCHADPNTALLKLRQFGERLAQQAAARFGVDSRGLDQLGLINELYHANRLQPDTASAFHLLRRQGNRANHEGWGATGDAIHALKHAFMLAGWFQQTFFDRGFKRGKFARPQPPDDPTAELHARLAEQEDRLAEQATLTANAKERAALEAERRRAAEAKAEAARGDMEAALALAEEAEQRYQEQLAEARAAAVASPPEQRSELVQRSKEADHLVTPDEAATRQLIDAQLRDAHWEADSAELTYGRGARPQKGRDLAIAEWPTASGPVDYVLFHGLTPLAVVEAKRQSHSALAAIDQAKRYSRDFVLGEGLTSPGGPWGAYRIPFLFATNGRQFLRQLEHESGIWLLDARRSTHHARALESWYSPAGLAALLRLDTAAADKALAATPADDLPLWDFQREAVRAVEAAIAEDQRKILVAMATGTGKTRTCIGLLYRLVKAGRFRRALFLVDRRALGEQAAAAFGELALEADLAFASIYDVKGLDEPVPEADTRVHLATVQGLVLRILYQEDPLPVDAYDLIVVDECHRGYALDREMGENEIRFRDQKDYQSKYRRVLDHFDAVKIGLTATPALHTTEIFGEPVYRYSYRRAVIEGYLIDHEPPTRIVTRLAEDGIHWEVGEPVQRWDPKRGQTDLIHAPDEIDIEIEGFNRQVITENFNRAVCAELTRHLDPSLPGKTLVFCVDERHAVLFVQLLKEAFTERYGAIDDDAIQKITGKSDRPLQKIKHFRNEAQPSIAVTVDLLTTGVDVPKITNLVFVRRVKSRILYEQMIGRATRRCEDLFGRGEDKEVFRIYDAVDLYASLAEHSDMQPVVVNPKVTFRSLVKDLSAVSYEPARQEILEQLIVQLRRRRRRFETHLADAFEAACGMEPTELIDTLKSLTPDAAQDLFAQHPRLVEVLDQRIEATERRILVSDHADEVVRVERGYGKGRQRPDDYLESFGRFLAENMNQIPALLVVTQRPRELTRQQLKELALALDAEGYSELQLQSAWRDCKNQDIAASIIGFIRQRALGDPLKPYTERVDIALGRLLAARDWTTVQRRWLERIGQQMKQETIVDRAALDQGQFRNDGGFKRFDRLFDGRLEELLGDLHEGVWVA